MGRRGLHVWPQVLLALGVLVGGAWGRALKEPAGFGKAHFGMSPAQVKKLYPSARTLGEENLGATPVFGPLVVRQALDDQEAPGLPKPVLVELRYWKERLWVVIVYYRENSSEQVVGALKRDLGQPATSAADPYWTASNVTVMTDDRQRWYAITDNALSKEAQEAFVAQGQGAQRQETGQQSDRAQPEATTAGGAKSQ